MSRADRPEPDVEQHVTIVRGAAPDLHSLTPLAGRTCADMTVKVSASDDHPYFARADALIRAIRGRLAEATCYRKHAYSSFVVHFSPNTPGA